MKFDYVIFGAGIYGLYAAHLLAQKDVNVAIIEFDSAPLLRASFINQARVHNGYHYPRSVSTAEKSAHYYERFVNDFSFAINDRFKKIYAISANDSLTNAEQFLRFCDYVKIPASEVSSQTYFNKGLVESTFETIEYTFDADIIRNWYITKLAEFKNVTIMYEKNLEKTSINDNLFYLHFKDKSVVSTPKVLNATYASINQIIAKFGMELFKTKYEICEVIMTHVSSNIKNVGITVMDGPFFSLMPFGDSGYHSLTSVGHTPHESSMNELPIFSCQDINTNCTSAQLMNCNSCFARPETAWIRMNQLAKKYLIPEIKVSYQKSLFAVKALVSASELDDSRPTVIKTFTDDPIFTSVFSGKFNTIYDLEEVL